MNNINVPALVSTDWLAERLDDPSIRVVDATWHLPTVGREGRGDYEAGHIPGAVFWDIDTIADPDDPLPHMLPAADDFARHMSALGIGDDCHVVIYDAVAMMTSPRVWWVLRHFGHERVSLLDGAMNKWLAEGRPVEPGAVTPPEDAVFTARPPKNNVRDLEQLRTNIESRAEQVLDARAAGRFMAIDPEPRPNSRGGHIPNSLNLPFGELLDPESKTVRPPEQLAQKFDEAGIDRTKPVVTTCGSGVTACVLALGLHLLGHDDVAVYDGSWSEWGTRQDTPIDP